MIDLMGKNPPHMGMNQIMIMAAHSVRMHDPRRMNVQPLAFKMTNLMFMNASSVKVNYLTEMRVPSYGLIDPKRVTLLILAFRGASPQIQNSPYACGMKHT